MRSVFFFVACTVFLSLSGVTSAESEPVFNTFSFEKIATLPMPKGSGGPLVGCDGKAMFVAGGSNFPGAAPWDGGEKKYYSDIFVALQGAGTALQWQEQSVRLPAEMGYAATVSVPGTGLVCLGGETAIGRLDKAFVIRFDTKKNTASIHELPSLPKPVTSASACFLDGRIHVLGGVTDDGFSDEMYSLAPSDPARSWRAEPKLPKPLAFAVSTVQSDGEANRLYLFGGRAKKPGEETTTFYKSVYSFNPKSGTWHEEPDMPMPLAAGCGSSLGVCSVFLFGGDDGAFFNANELRQNALDREQDEIKKRELLDEKNHLLETHGGFRREVFLYNTITKTWSVPTLLPEGSQVTTGAFAWSRGASVEVVIPSGEVRPGVRTDAVSAFRVIGKTKFTALDYAILAAYMIGMLAIGFMFMKKEGTTGDFFLGGGRLPWWAVGISIFATTLSAITFLSIPAKAFASDWRMLFFNFGILLIAPIIIFFYLPFFRKLKLDTAYEYLEYRFNRLTRLIASGLFVVFMVLRISIVLFLPSLAMNIATGLDVYFCIVVMSLVTIAYCTFGGMEAVVWSDVIQGFILVGGALTAVIVMIACTDGGAAGFFNTSMEFGKLRMFDFRLDWTQPVFWVVLVGSFANNIITYSSDQTLVQRYMCATDDKQTVRSIWLNALIAVPVSILFFLIGTALFAYYRSHPGLMDAGLRNADAIFPLFIVNGLPPGVSGLLIAAIFAAAMSTLSSNINSASAALYSDFLKFLTPAFAQKHAVRLSQAVGIVVGLLGMALALFLATFDIKSLWDLFNAFLGLFTGPVGGLFLMGISSRRVNGFGAVTGLFGSAAVVAIVQSRTNLSFILYGFIGMFSCYLIGYLASLLYGGPARMVDAREDH